MSGDPSVIEYKSYGDENRGYHLEVRKHDQAVLRVSDFGEQYQARVMTDEDLDALYDHVSAVMEFADIQEFAVESAMDGVTLLEEDEYDAALEEDWDELDGRAGLRQDIDGVDVQGEYRGATIKTIMDRRYVVFRSAHDTEDVMREVRNGDYLPPEIDEQVLKERVAGLGPDDDGTTGSVGPDAGL